MPLQGDTNFGFGTRAWRARCRAAAGGSRERPPQGQSAESAEAPPKPRSISTSTLGRGSKSAGVRIVIPGWRDRGRLVGSGRLIAALISALVIRRVFRTWLVREVRLVLRICRGNKCRSKKDGGSYQCNSYQHRYGLREFSTPATARAPSSWGLGPLFAILLLHQVGADVGKAAHDPVQRRAHLGL